MGPLLHPFPSFHFYNGLWCEGTPSPFIWVEKIPWRMFFSSFGPWAESVSGCRLRILNHPWPPRGRTEMPDLISIHPIGLSLVLAQNQTGRKPQLNFLHPNSLRDCIRVLTAGCRGEPHQRFHEILAMVAASWWVTRTFLRGRWP